MNIKQSTTIQWIINKFYAVLKYQLLNKVSEQCQYDHEWILIQNYNYPNHIEIADILAKQFVLTL